MNSTLKTFRSLEKVLKILDDVVNAESTLIDSEKQSTSSMASSLSPRVKRETLVFEFKPPGSSSSNHHQQQQRPKTTPNSSNRQKDDGGFFMSAREFISGGGAQQPYQQPHQHDDDKNHHNHHHHFKPNPLHVIDEDDAERRALDRAQIVRKLDSLLTNGGHAGERFKKSF